MTRNVNVTEHLDHGGVCVHRLSPKRNCRNPLTNNQKRKPGRITIADATNAHKE